MSNIISQIVQEAQHSIDHIIKLEQQWHDKNEKVFSEWSKSITRLRAMHKLLRAMHIHLQDGDAFISAEFKIKSTAELVITLTFSRNEKIESIVTRIIIAGGYNIQCMHYRYISNCSAKRQFSLSDQTLKNLEKQIKSMTKEQKLSKEIAGYQTRIDDTHAKLAINEAKSDAEIIKESGDKGDWTRSLNKSFEEYYGDGKGFMKGHTINTPEKWEEWKTGVRTMLVEHFNRQIASDKRYVATLTKLINKTQQKLDKLINTNI